jgi:hypothetical protein
VIPTYSGISAYLLSNISLLDISYILPLVLYIFYLYYLYIQSMLIYNMPGALG